jgi:hypothetical protein
MANSNELMALDKEFSTGGSDYYRRHPDNHCMIAFAATPRGTRRPEPMT